MGSIYSWVHTPLNCCWVNERKSQKQERGSSATTVCDCINNGKSNSVSEQEIHVYRQFAMNDRVLSSLGMQESQYM